jgi:hypothetical protein
MVFIFLRANDTPLPGLNFIHFLGGLRGMKEGVFSLHLKDASKG